MNNSAQLLARQVESLLTGIVNNSKVALSPQPKRVIPVAPGMTVAWDDCCQGQLWGRVVNLSAPPGQNPVQRPGLSPSSVPWFLATLEVGILRCAAVFDDNSGRAPSPSQITDNGQQAIDDMAAIVSILRCTEGVRSVLGWTPTGPEGGCHGGFWTFTALIANCLEC